MADLNLANEMVASCAARLGGGGRETAVKGIRAICRHFGGQLLYLPRYKKDESDTAEQFWGILADAVGDADADVLLEVLMGQFGGVPLYIPKEDRAFRNEMAKEIKAEYDGTKQKRGELCRRYNMSFTQLYRLCHRALELEQEERSPTLFDNL